MAPKTLYFFNNACLDGRDTNILTRKKMVKAFADKDHLDKVVVYYIVGSRKERDRTVEELKEGVVEPRPVYLPGYCRGSGDSVFRRLYRVLILNRLLGIFYIFRFFTVSDSVTYIWGLQPAVALAPSKFWDENFCILELDDYMVGKSYLRDTLCLRASSLVHKISTVSRKTKKDLTEKGVGSEKIDVVPNAVDFERFKLDKEKKELRRELGMSEDSFIVAYTGHLYDWKGVDNLLKAVNHIPYDDLEVVLVGGRKKEIERYREVIERRSLEEVVRIEGYVSREKVPKYQNASDVLVAPNTSNDEKSAEYTSPVKLREYMASGTPVIASDLPAIRDIASSGEITYFKPDDPERLAEKIIEIRENPERFSEKARRGVKKAARFSWRDRAEKILESVGV